MFIHIFQKLLPSLQASDTMHHCLGTCRHARLSCFESSVLSRAGHVGSIKLRLVLKDEYCNGIIVVNSRCQYMYARYLV